MIKVVGGVYYERCIHPTWQELFGSAGRAASALSNMGEKVELHSFLDKTAEGIIRARAALEEFDICPKLIDQTISFNYIHELASPIILDQTIMTKSLKVDGDKIIRFGMIEGDAIVKGDYVVYDPQNIENPKCFNVNGSKANHLAIVLNRREASLLTGLKNASPEEMAEALVSSQEAEVVVIKLGPLGALVYHRGKGTIVPAFRTEKVWTIGSGDTFVAHFALHWFAKPEEPHQAACDASIATSYYCSTKGFSTPTQLQHHSPTAIKPSEKCFSDGSSKVYLAGPFFTLAQRWLIEQARDNLISMGLEVFSPVHDVGFGVAEDVVQKDIDGIKDCDLMLAIVDGLDTGTIYEIGYARALNKPVIVYCENEKDEDKKMMAGSGCIISKDYASAIYQTLWSSMSI